MSNGNTSTFTMAKTKINTFFKEQLNNEIVPFRVRTPYVVSTKTVLNFTYLFIFFENPLLRNNEFRSMAGLWADRVGHFFAIKK